ncbi:bifunctional (p)ppGpp synthetase/guanosine-3',5'-bis(diphosphate) 3'-pyrophosphohydrolase [Hwanghaeella grinnelliae]|uniref:GTP pyrophosphokinase rsh n=1 Tax=Hwanghaeella grinnelliae TaxID=2500179 RepID=A0A3S2W842_9PROT|nr:bifunctional (p)ppGpp synthetase/guanosine-3',5'-bis(diphosphate) 3'-pyrophosphohydrolase [Hwanghaeella grinnelliae]RVU39529.1 bifunctional (p)ppGpp synthetase/guanosine-3',5'-bis(diphosphate) 3'-pyrophosphohydrolase [Hwanghaeella grinnelliae]
MLRQYELVERVKHYDPGADEGLLNRAYVFAMKAHGTQTRASGDPYFSHPVEVAGLLSEKRLDASSIVTGLLHDTVEDTDATLEIIQDTFGPEVAGLVDGVTKLTQLELQSSRTKQAENFRKLVLAMSQDIRVLVVKLADRLHNMRTLHFISKEEKRRRIALETMEIYVPLTERIGIRDWKDELEDLAFAELNPDARSSIVNRLHYLHEESGDTIGKVVAELQTLLEANEIEATVLGREKSPFSIWRKMQRQNIGFEQLSDIVAFRVIVENLGDCYRALGCIHGRYTVTPGRFKDYISLPKPNGYQSLHTGVIGPENTRIEVQIRTQEMHDVAELGVAAHWRYKANGSEAPAREGRQYRWMRDMLDILSNASGPDDFLENTKMEMFADQVFVFTPKGDLHAMPRGSTPVDFAYAVHTDVGNRTVGAKINGRIKPLRTELRNGDQVEIITSKAQTPSPAWEAFIVTGKARSAIRRFVRSKQRDQYFGLGREVLDSTFRQGDYDLTEKALRGVTAKFKVDTVDDLYVAVGEGRITGRDVLYAVYPGAKAEQAQELEQKKQQIPPTQKAKDPHRHSVPVKGLIKGMAIHYARCCHPLPGDRIVGIVTTGRGVTIHTINCSTLEDFADSPDRWLDVSWDTDAEEPQGFMGRVHAVIANEPGSLGTISSVIGRSGGNIFNLKFTNRGEDFYEMLLDIEVTGVRQLSNIMAALRATPVVNSVDRAFS